MEIQIKLIFKNVSKNNCCNKCEVMFSEPKNTSLKDVLYFLTFHRDFLKPLSLFSLHIISLNSSFDNFPSPSLSFLANTADTWKIVSFLNLPQKMYIVIIYSPAFHSVSFWCQAFLV